MRPLINSTVVSCYNVNHQVLFWGPEYRVIYNDGYRHTMGDKHPAYLGMCAFHTHAHAHAHTTTVLAELIYNNLTLAHRHALFGVLEHDLGAAEAVARRRHLFQEGQLDRRPAELRGPIWLP